VNNIALRNIFNQRSWYYQNHAHTHY